MHWKDYDYAVINDNVEKCYKSIINFINKKKNRNSLSYNKKFIQNHINNLIN